VSTPNRGRRALILAVTALALVAIVWRLVAPPPSGAAQVEPERATESQHATTTSLLQGVEIAEKSASDRTVPRADERATTPTEPAAATGSGGFLVYGLVKSVTGQDAISRETYVSLSDASGASRRTQAAMDGAYSFADLALGRYWLRAGSSPRGEARATIVVAADLRLDIQLVEAASVRVRALDTAGAPLKQGPFEILAVATLAPPGTWFDEVSGSHNNPFGVGRYEHEDFTGGIDPAGWIGRVVLDVDPPVHVSLIHNQYVVATQLVAPGQTEVTFTVDREAVALRKSTIRFRFVDALSGERIEKTSVSINSSSSTRMGKPPTDGQHELSGLSPGTYVIHAHAKGFGDPALRVRVEPGVDQDLGDIPLDPGVSITGRVLDPDGQGVVADVRYDPCGEDGLPLAHVGTVYITKSDAEGTFKIGGLKRGRYELSISNEAWGLWRTQVDARAGSVENVEARMRTAVPLVVSGSNDGWSQVRFRILDAEGNSVHDGRLWQPEPRPIRLSPGSYQVEVRATSEAEPRRIPITIASEPVHLSLP
jgi:hypothetical protein